MKKTLIQANNLDTVIDVFMYTYLHPGCKKQDIADYCGFSLRQVDYYIGACKYLDLLNKDLSPTDISIKIFEERPAEITDCVYECIISDKLMGQIYKKMVEEPTGNHFEFAKELVMHYYPGMSEAVYVRRSDNIVKWCKKIINYYK
jgi:hypothetical protein